MIFGIIRVLGLSEFWDLIWGFKVEFGVLRLNLGF